MPFFEMIARFQMTLRKQNTTLFIIGYNFGDEHINRIIEEAININNSLHIFVINPIVISPSIKKILDDVTNLREKLFRYVQNGYSGITFIVDTFSNFTKQLPEIKYPDIEEEKQKQLSLQLNDNLQSNKNEDEN